MKTVVRIHSETGRLNFGYWDEKREEFIPVNTDEECVAAAEKLDCSAALVQTLVTVVDSIQEAVRQDLTDIWHRLDGIEKSK